MDQQHYSRVVAQMGGRGRGGNDDHERQVGALEDTIDTWKQAVALQRTVIEGQDQTIAVLNTALDDASRSISGLKEVVALMEQHCAVRDEIIEAKDAIVAQQKQQLALLNETVSRPRVVEV